MPTVPLPAVTIGLPCYNAEDTIGRALQSALNQDYPHLEILVVDDASTDRSFQTIEALARQDPRISLVRNSKNGGVGATRNRITSQARGELIVFFDDDDVSHPQRVSVQVRRLLEYETSWPDKLIACYASGERVYPNGYTIHLRAIGSQSRIPSGPAVADYLLFNHRQPGVFYGAGTPASALLLRKTTIERIGGFDSALRRVEDSDLSIRLALQGAHFIGCPEPLYTQYASVGADKTPQANFQSELALVEKHKTYLVARRRFGYARRWFRLRYFHFNGNRLKAILYLAYCWLCNPWAVSVHFLRSAPRRLLREFRMGKRGGGA